MSHWNGPPSGGDKGPVVLTGDFNATHFSRILKTVLTRSHLANIGSFEGTWPTMWPALLRVPLDHVLVSPGLPVGRQLGPPIGSDHLPLLVRVSAR